jgi:hypothetical protein
MFNSYKAIITIKYDPAGNFLWEYEVKSSDDASGEGIAADADGNVYTAGFITVDDGFNDMAVLKYDPGGNLLWSKKEGTGGEHDEAYAIAIGSSTVYVAGKGDSSGITVLMYDPLAICLKYNSIPLRQVVTPTP